FAYSRAMRALLIPLALLGCGKGTSTSVAKGDYCRGQRKYTSAPGPLGTIGGSSQRPTNTFSIVARAPVTGDLGVAVQSHWFSVGSAVTWAEPGIGAVAT